MKYNLLKKKCIIQGLIVLAIVGLLGAGTYFVSDWLEQTTQQKNRLEGEVSAVTNESNGLREKFIRIQSNKQLYEVVMALHDSDMLSHSPERADQRLREYEQNYALYSWAMDSVAAKNAPDGKYKRKTSFVAARDGKLTVEATSDEDIYALIAAMQKDFPGSVSFAALQLTKNSALTAEMLNSITTLGSAPLVKAEIAFVWFGIEPTDPEAALKRAAERMAKKKQGAAP